MMTDLSVLEWASGWLRENTTEDPTFRQRFLDGLMTELQSRRAEECALIVAWLYSKDARRYTEVGPLIAKALLEGRHRNPPPAPECTCYWISGQSQLNPNCPKHGSK